MRNGVESAFSSEVNDRTPCEFLKILTGSGFNRRLSAAPHTTGVELTFDVPFATAEVRIERVNQDQFGAENFGLVTTLLNQAAGIGTFIDTGVTEGRLYTYRARVEQAGEDPSGWALHPKVQAGGGATGLPSVTAGNIISTDTDRGFMRLTAGANVSNFLEGDQLRLFIGPDGAFPSNADIIFTGSGLYRANWPCPNTATTLSLKWEVWQQGNLLIETKLPANNGLNPCTGIAF